MSNDTVQSPAATKRSSSSSLRILGVLLILIAFGMQFRSCRGQQASFQAAKGLSEAVLENGAKGVMVQHTLEGMDLPPILFRCDNDMATNLLIRMVQAQPAKFPKEAIDGDLFVIHVVGTNDVVREFRAVRPSSDPSNALVGLLSRDVNEEGAPIESAAAPALVVGAGDILGDILKKLVEQGEQISADPKFKENFTQLLEKAAKEHAAAEAKASATEEAPVADAPKSVEEAPATDAPKAAEEAPQETP